MKKALLALVFGLVILLACNKKNDLDKVDCSKINANYSSSIKPIIEGNCLSSGCHNAGSVNGDFTTYDGLKAKVDNGSLDTRVIKNKSMPPSGALHIDNLKRIKCWLNSGALNN